jgi:hypothetical protein
MKTEFSIDEFNDDCVVEDFFEDSRVAKIIDEMEFTDDDNYFDDKDIRREIVGKY